MIFGFIISIYILKDKEIFIQSSKKFLYALFNKSSVNTFLSFGKEVDSIFSRYIIGKAIDSTIIGLLCAIGMSLLDAPYGLLISLIVGVTNMIPYFGPFIGMIPAFFITLLFDPIKALWVLLFVFILQQFDGFYLGPKILGEKVGVSPFWIILAVTLGGGTFGVLGMFLGVPIIAIAKILIERFIEKRLKTKDIHLDD
jgi:predicted PurR-regulated permease PerM